MDFSDELKYRLGELTPEQWGRIIGYSWAGKRWTRTHTGDELDDELLARLTELRRVSGGHIPDDTRAMIEELLGDSNDPEMFWYGFSWGVQALLEGRGYTAPTPRRE